VAPIVRTCIYDCLVSIGQTVLVTNPTLPLIVPEPPNNTTTAHTVSQPRRDKKHIMRVGCDKT
jgi:hypothetical protein